MAEADELDSVIPPLAELKNLLCNQTQLSVRALASLGAALIKHERYQTAVDVLQTALDDVLTDRKRPHGSLGDVYLNLGIAFAGLDQHQVRSATKIFMSFRTNVAVTKDAVFAHASAGRLFQQTDDQE